MNQIRSTKVVTEVKLSHHELARIVADRLGIQYEGASFDDGSFIKTIVYSMRYEEDVLDTVEKTMEIMTK